MKHYNLALDCVAMAIGLAKKGDLKAAATAFNQAVTASDSDAAVSIINASNQMAFESNKALTASYKKLVAGQKRLAATDTLGGDDNDEEEEEELSFDEIVAQAIRGENVELGDDDDDQDDEDDDNDDDNNDTSGETILANSLRIMAARSRTKRRRA